MQTALIHDQLQSNPYEIEKSRLTLACYYNFNKINKKRLLTDFFFYLGSQCMYKIGKIKIIK